MRIVILSYSSCERKGSRMIKKISENIGHQNDQEIKLQYFPEKPKFSWRERLARNLALSGMLVLTIVAVKDAQISQFNDTVSVDHYVLRLNVAMDNTVVIPCKVESCGDRFANEQTIILLYMLFAVK